MDYRHRTIIKTILLFLVVFLFALYFRSLLLSLPSIYDLEDYTPSLITKVYDYKGELITELFAERRTLTPLSTIPVDLQNAVLAIEDNKFFEHFGVSFRGIMRAFVNNIRKRRVSQGGSTITQQLAKTIFLTPERTITRKIKELLLTLQLEHQFTKEEILQLYLNQIYFGSGAYGVQAAAKTYFSKNVQDLNLAECAMIAGLPRAPNYYAPFKSAERAIRRRAIVLRRMQELDYISSKEEYQANLIPLNTEKSTTTAKVARYFIEYVRLQLEPKYGSQAIYHGGLSIYTTLDKEAQIGAEESFDRVLEWYDGERLEYFEENLSTPTAVQGALVAVDPKTGAIRAMIGGRSFNESQFNRAHQAKRQPGSAFKPFIYTAAIENGFTAATQLEDSPLVYENDGNDWRLISRTTDYLIDVPEEVLEDEMRLWVPSNYGNKYFGKVLLRKGLERSLNSCAIQILQQIGPMCAIDYARRMGIKSSLTNTLSLALGSSDLNLMELVGAFSVLASGGIKTHPYAVVRVEDKDGRVLEENMPFEEAVLSPQTSYIMTNLLSGVVQHGTGRAALALRRPCAGKTGTTNDFTDAWFVGFTPQLACGVWVGYDDRTFLGDKMTGGRLACPIWTGFMRKALKNEPKMEFTPPEGITFTLIDPLTGLLALSKTPNAYLEAFVDGTEPTEYYSPELSDELDMIEEVPQEEEDGF